MSTEAVECAIVSFDKASEACKIKRQQELEVTKLDYELETPSPGYPFARLNKTLEEVFRILLKDALNSHWIQLYNSTIWKNFGLFMYFYSKAKNMEIQTVGDFTRTYNFFVRNSLQGVKMVRIIPRPLFCYFVWKWCFRLLTRHWSSFLLRMPESNACITKEAVSSDMTSGDLVVRIRRRRKESRTFWRLDVTDPLGL